MAGELAKRINELEETTSPAGTDSLAVDTSTGTRRATVNTLRNLATAVPPMNGVAAVGASLKAAREDHIHPTDTSRMPATHPASAITGLGDATPAAVAETGVIGTSTKPARQDHVHPVPAWIARRLTGHVTVSLNASMSAAQIQATVDAQPKNLNGYSLTFQLENGLYPMASKLSFLGFYAGSLRLQGNPANTSLAADKLAALQFAALGSEGILMGYGGAEYVVRYLKIIMGDANNAVYFLNLLCAHFVAMSTVIPGTAGAGVQASAAAAVNVSNSYFAGGGYGIASLNCSSMMSLGNASDPANLPQYGLRVAAGNIYKGGAQPAGVWAESVNTGGQIWS
ncbi:hypothetical protein [Megalodesulfovibrio gigas]|uniref:Putative phage-related tail fiber protein n=1 Tax=Megalodesulfovibrio gigas (strain ATCC 19364 / DSM 1382 / NCIMB 9332 / VKM B-1759) TaxID=1121448 RepID=T2G979_MEGG1|nr:hypothetical protein [Megalodesulfovibrio gigas]AGW12848.1 putative phage-related tail fiber protein [Megalodesulfovibrio gigas DSM 1382 = ATCC 19364]